MKKYYVNDNAQANGDHEVHTPSILCSYMPDHANRTYLGEFDTCKEAVREAKKKHDQVNGCYYCCNECHKG